MVTNGDSERWPQHGMSQMDFLLGSIVGFVAGAWMAFCGLLFIKRWRYTFQVQGTLMLLPGRNGSATWAYLN
jgi:hypothetical protein